MTSPHSSNNECLLRWQEGVVDYRAEHFRLHHPEMPGAHAALVGPREPMGLCVEFHSDLPTSVLRDLRDELWSWCTPRSDDPWFAVDLWHHLAEYALDETCAGPVGWELMPRHSIPGTEPPFVEDVTALFRTWLRHIGKGPEQEARIAFVRDYVALFAVVGGEQRQTLGRLARLVRLQTGEDPTAKFEVRLTGPANEDVPIRVGNIEDFDFADAWACMPYAAFEVTKLDRTQAGESSKWSRGEIRALLRHVDVSLASEVPCAGLVAETEGPRLMVRMREDG